MSQSNIACSEKLALCFRVNRTEGYNGSKNIFGEFGPELCPTYFSDAFG